MSNAVETWRRSLISFVSLLRSRILQAKGIKPSVIMLLASVIIYGIVFSYFTIYKYNVFLSFAWDLGIFDQALYTTAFHGRFLFYTAELYLVPSGSYFASHFSPILLLMLPLYYIFPSAITLLVLQSFVLASAAIPLYLVAKKILTDGRSATIISLIYLLYPPLQASNWFDFHTQAFLPLTLFSAYYFMETKRWKSYWIAALLALMVEEHVSILISLIGIYLMIVCGPTALLDSLKSHRMNKALVSLATSIIGVIWFFLSQFVKRTFYINPQFVVRYQATSAFATLGIQTDPILLPLYILQNPVNVWNALMYDFHVKLFFLIVLFAPILFLSFKSKFSLIVLTLLVPSLLSDYLAYHTIGAQYPLFVVPLIFIAFLIALRQMHVSVHSPLLKIAFMVSMLFCVSLSPISPLSMEFAQKELVWYPQVPLSYTKHIETLHDLLNLIPPDSSVLTQNHLFPHLSSRLEAFVLPLIGQFENDTAYIKSLTDKSEYVLLDMWSWDYATELVFNEITKNDNYDFYAFGFNSLLFKKGYKGSPIYGDYLKNGLFQPFKDLLVPSGKAAEDPSSKSGIVAFSLKGESGVVIHGPYTYALPGEYKIDLIIKVGEHDDGPIGKFVILDEQIQILSMRDFYGFELEAETWTNITVMFSSTKLRRGLNFLLISSGKADIYVDGIVSERTSKIAKVDFGLMTYNPENLFLEKGYINYNGFFIHNRNQTSDFFWWGPYISLPAGDYRASYYMKFSPNPLNATERLITLDVSANSGKKIIAEHDVYSSEIFPNNGEENWQKFEIEFTVKEELEKVEFRGRIPSQNCEIHLAFTLIERLNQ